MDLDFDIDNMSPSELADLYEQVMDYYKYNKLESFTPYPYQMKFAKASKVSRRRLMRAANQIGKSYGASFEVAYHLTGKYPDWWEGDVIKESGHIYWCVGVKIDSTARVMQKALLGTEDIRKESQIGVGSIPRSAIVMDNMIKDGPIVKSMSIKHVDGGYNTLQFFAAAQGQEQLMGAVVKFIWLDEESPHNFLEIYSQVCTRTTTTDGHVMITATPEMGFTDFQRLFAEDKSGELYLQTVSWWDCPHLTEEGIKKLLASYPEYQREMRSKGIPVIGSGAILPFKDSEIMCEDLTPMDHWQVVAGLDFSSVVDASVIAYTAYDPDGDCYYLYHLDFIDEIENKNPEYMAKLVLASPTPHIPCVSPHDGSPSMSGVNPQSKAKIMRSLGVEVPYEPFYNGSELSISFKDRKNFSREPGLEYMRQLMREGRFKVCRSCTKFFDEKAGLFYAPKTGGGIKTVGKDDAIDATRYSLISLVGMRGLPYGQCKTGDIDKWNNGFNQDVNECIVAYDPYDL